MAARLRKPRSGYFWLMVVLFTILLFGLLLLVEGFLNGAPPFPTQIML